MGEKGRSWRIPRTEGVEALRSQVRMEEKGGQAGRQGSGEASLGAEDFSRSRNGGRPPYLYFCLARE